MTEQLAREVLNWIIPVGLGLIGWYLRKISETLVDLATEVRVEKQARVDLERRVDRTEERVDRIEHSRMN